MCPQIFGVQERRLLKRFVNEAPLDAGEFTSTTTACRAALAAATVT